MNSSLRSRVTAWRQRALNVVRQFVGKPPVGAPARPQSSPPAAPKEPPPELPTTPFTTSDDVRAYLRILKPVSGAAWITESNAAARDLLFETWSAVVNHCSPTLAHKDILKIIGEESPICDVWAWKVLIASDPQTMVPHLARLERWQHPAIEAAKETWMNEIVRTVYTPEREMKDTPLTTEEHEALRARFQSPIEDEQTLARLMTWLHDRKRLPSDLLPVLATQPTIHGRSMFSLGLVGTLGTGRKWSSGAQRADIGEAILTEPALWKQAEVRALCWGLLADHPELWWSVLQHRTTWPPRWEPQWHESAEQALKAAPAAAARAVLRWDIARHGAMPRPVIRWALLQKNRDIRTKAIAHAGELLPLTTPDEAAAAELADRTRVVSAPAASSRTDEEKMGEVPPSPPPASHGLSR